MDPLYILYFLPKYIPELYNTFKRLGLAPLGLKKRRIKGSPQLYRCFLNASSWWNIQDSLFSV